MRGQLCFFGSTSITCIAMSMRPGTSKNGRAQGPYALSFMRDDALPRYASTGPLASMTQTGDLPTSNQFRVQLVCLHIVRKTVYDISMEPIGLPSQLVSILHIYSSNSISYSTTSGSSSNSMHVGSRLSCIGAYWMESSKPSPEVDIL